MQGLVKAEEADIPLFLEVARTAQALARRLGDLQSASSVHGLTPHEASTLVALLRGAGEDKMGLSKKEVKALVYLVDGASKAAAYIPSESREARESRQQTGVSITGLVTALLNCGNLLETAAKNAQPSPIEETA